MKDNTIKSIIMFCIGLAVGLFLYKQFYLGLVALLFIGLSGIIFVGTNKKYWTYYGAPVVGLVASYIIGYAFL